MLRRTSTIQSMIQSLALKQAKSSHQLLFQPSITARRSIFFNTTTTTNNSFTNQQPTTQTRFYSKHSIERESLFDTWKKTLKQELEKNKDVQQVTEEMKQTKTAKVAGDAAAVAQKAAAKAKEAASPYVQAVGESLEAGGAKTLELIQKAAESKVGQAIGNTIDSVANQKVIKYVVDDLYEEERMRQKMNYIFRSPHGRKEDAEIGIYYNPYTQRMEKMEEVERNETETGIVLHDEGGVRGRYGKQRGSRLQMVIKTLNDKDMGGLKKMSKIMGDSLASFGDKIFTETEEAQVLGILKNRDSTFNLDRFLANVENVVLPYVLDAYFRDDDATLKRYVTEECYRSTFYPRLYERNFSKTYFDTKILDIKDVTPLSIRFLADDPIIVIGCQVQYIYCIRDKIKNEIVEGHANDIRMESQLWSLRQDPSMETNDWEIFECAIGVDPVKIV